MKKNIIFMLLMAGYCISNAQLRPTRGCTSCAYANPTLEDESTPGISGAGLTPATAITNTTNPVTTAQWRFVGQQNDASSDWIYALLTTNKRETIACGFGHNSSDSHSGTIFKLDHNGKMSWDRAVDPSGETLVNFSSYTLPSVPAKNDLFAIAKAGDGYVAVGRGTHGMLIVEVDESGNFINGTPIDVVPPSSATYPSSFDLHDASGHAFAVAVDPNTNSVNNIIVGGTITGTFGGSSYNGAGILELNYSGGSWSVGSSYYDGNGASYGNGVSGSQIMKIITQSTGSGTYEIYACGALSESGDNLVHSSTTNAESGGTCTLTTFDKDIWILKMNNSMSSTSTQHYNKSNITIGGTDLNTINSTTYPYQDFGPLTARNHDLIFGSVTGAVGWISGIGGGTDYSSAATAPLNSSNNLNEEGYDMIFTKDGKLAVISLVNLIGLNCKTDEQATDGTVVEAGFGGAAPQFAEYSDGDAFLLKIDPSDLSLIGAKNVGHFSGTDFFPQVRQDREGDYIIAGSTSDRYGTVTATPTGGIVVYTYTPNTNYNLPDADFADGLDNALIVSTDDNFPGSGDLWRRSYLASADSRATDVGPGGSQNMIDNMMCVFALDTTADGGYEIGGNNSHNNDDYTLTKFAPPYQQSLIASGGYCKFGYTDIPATYTVSSSETWPSTNVPDGSNIATWIIVPSGSTLTISSGTYHFAASDQIWDYWISPDNYSTGGGTIGSGILVQPGGQLVVDDATLTSVSIAGSGSTLPEHNVWDGIVIQGVYAGAPTTSVQGSANLSGATIQDARAGVYVADNYRSYFPTPVASYTSATSSATGFTYGSRYDGTYNLGGGILAANNDGATPTTFLNCWLGTDFQNYFFYRNTSSIVKCAFNSDNTGMGDACFYTDANGDNLPGNTFITAWQWYGVDIRKNTFTCDVGWPSASRTNGIVIHGTANISNSGTGTDAGNSFSNLNYAIMASDACGSFGTNIAYNTFDNNNYCINASGMANTLVVQYNTFNIPGNNPYYNPTAITLAGCSGYDASQNTFDKCSTCSTAISWVNNAGIVVNNGAVQNELVNLNTFDHVWFATNPLGNNGSSTAMTGLQFHCNDYAQNVYGLMRSSYFAGASSAPGTIAPIQGLCGTATLPAGNQFYTCSSTPTPPRIFAADDQVTQDVTYNNNSSASGSVFDPGSGGTCIQTHNSLATGDPEILINNSCSTTPVSVDDACPTPPFHYYSPYPGPGKGGLVSALQEIGSLDQAIAANTDQDIAIALQTLHDFDVSFVARFYSQLDSMDSAAAILAYYGRYRDALPFYVAAGDFTDAYTMLSDLPLATADDKLYAWEAGLMLSLYSNGDSWYALDTTSQDSLLKISQYNSAAGYMAGSIAALLGIGQVTWPVPVLPQALTDSVIGDSSSYASRTAASATTNNSTKPISTVNANNVMLFSVYPNPNSGFLTVQTSLAGILTLYTMLGQYVTEYAVSSGKTGIELPGNVSPGMYMGKFIPADGTEAKTISIVYQQ